MAEREYIWAVALKIQTVKGTDAVPTFVANAVRHVGNPAFVTINHLDDGDASDQQFGGLGIFNEGEKTGEWGQFDITLAVKGAGADYFVVTNRPEWDAPLRASGFAVAATGASGSGVLTYKPFDSGTFEYLSAYLQGANKLFKLVDCVALPKFSADAAKKGLFTFTIIGRVASILETVYTGQTLSSVTAPAFKGAAVSLGAWTSADSPNPLILHDCAIDFGAGYTPQESAGATDGLAGFEINDRKLSFSATVAVVPLTKFDPWAESRVARPSGTSRKPVFQLGTLQFSRVKFSLGEWAFKPPVPAGKNRLLTYPLSGPVLAKSHTNTMEIEIIAD